MPLKTPDLPDCLAREPALAAKLRALAKGARFENVIEHAQPALCAAIARAARHRLWLVCGDVRTQEHLHNEIAQWHPAALFFPEIEIAPIEGAVPDPEAVAERLGVVQQLAGNERLILVLTRASLGESVVDEAELRRLEFQIRRGAKLDRDALLKQLGDAGYELVPQVGARGQYAVRGGIVDVFSFHHALPVRLEWFDDELESIRQFDLDAQTSVEQLQSVTLLLGEAESVGKKLGDYIRETDVTVDVDAGWLDAAVSICSAGLSGSDAATDAEDFSTAFFDHGLGEFDAGDFVVDEFKRERFFAQLREWREQSWTTFIFCNNEGEVERLHDLLPPVEADAIRFVIGTLGRGFTFPAGKIAALCDSELFGRYRNNRAHRIALKRQREVAHRQQIDFSELTDGDLVVHLEHGIARFEELKRVGDEDVLVLTFAENAKLYVPLEQSYLVARYVGIGKRNPPLSKLGDAAWANAKKKAEKAVFDYAARLLEVHAQRRFSTKRRRIKSPPSPTRRPTWKVSARWTASSAATLALEKPRSPSARRSRPCARGNRSPSSSPRPCSPSSTTALSASG
jgi:transcription-repair coupling factor (superfamily II helicase)